MTVEEMISVLTMVTGYSRDYLITLTPEALERMMEERYYGQSTTR